MCDDKCAGAVCRTGRYGRPDWREQDGRAAEVEMRRSARLDGRYFNMFIDKKRFVDNSSTRLREGDWRFHARQMM